MALTTLLVTIPAYNEEDNIGKIIRGIVQLSLPRVKKEVIVIDDGSKDGTAAVAKREGVFVVSHKKNRGYGGALQTCFQVARTKKADLLVVIDGDGQHDPKEIPKLIAPILRKRADLVIGSRFLNPNDTTPLIRKLGIKAVNFFYNFGAKTKISDSQSGFRAYCKRAVDVLSLEEKGMAISTEILVKTRRKNFTMEEVPISCRYFRKTHSRVNLRLIKRGFVVIFSTLKTRILVKDFGA